MARKAPVIRMTEEEHDELAQAAAQAGETFNEYVLTKALGRKPSTPASPTRSPLPNRVDTLYAALELSLDGHIQQAQALLARKEGSDGNKDTAVPRKGKAAHGRPKSGGVRHARSRSTGKAKRSPDR